MPSNHPEKRDGNQLSCSVSDASKFVYTHASKFVYMRLGSDGIYTGHRDYIGLDGMSLPSVSDCSCYWCQL